MRHALVAVVLLLLTVPAVAQDSWEYHTRAGDWAIAHGDAELAEEHFRRSLVLAQKLPPGDPKLETSLSNLARLYEYHGRFTDAQPMYQLLLAAREERLGEDQPALLEPLLGVARTALRTGDTPVATEHLERYVGLAESTGEAEPEQEALALSLLARIVTLEERPVEALPLRRRAVAVLEEAPDVTPDELAVEVVSLSQVELLHGDPTAGGQAALRAAELRLEAGEATAAAIGLAEAARTAVGAAEPAIGRRLATAALEIAATAPQDAGATAAARQALADAAWLEHRRAGRPADVLAGGAPDPDLDAAAAAVAAWLEIQRSEPASDPAALAAPLGRLALLEAAAGDADGAIHWQRELAQTTGTREASADLVALVEAAGRPADASALNLRLLAELEAEHGEIHPSLLEPLAVQQRLYETMGERRDAKRTAKRIRKLERKLR